MGWQRKKCLVRWVRERRLVWGGRWVGEGDGFGDGDGLERATGWGGRGLGEGYGLRE